MEKKTITLEEFNKRSREALDNYYKTGSADDFFTIDSMLRVCNKQGFTKEEIPTLIEMKNVIVMG